MSIPKAVVSPSTGAIFAALAFSLVLIGGWLPGNRGTAEAAFYRGGGPGIRVEFQIKHRRVIYGSIKAATYCTKKHPYRRFRQRLDALFGDYTRKLPPSGHTIFNFVIHLKAGNRIREGSAGSNTSASSYEAWRLVGRVHPGRLTGGFMQATTGLSSYPSENADCRTDRFWRAGSHSKHTRLLRFAARRVHRG